MCLLTYYPAGIRPDCEALHAGAELNPDGYGYAIVTRGRLLVGHGMTPDRMIERFDKARAAHPDGPALFHCRLGTGGTRNRFNCHPFHLYGDRGTVMAHNGILPSAMQPGRKDRRCDTRYAAEELLGFDHLSGRLSRARLGKRIGKWNKFVILTVNPAYSQSSYIINEKSGVWDNGVWYSNTDYQWRGTGCPTCGNTLKDDRCTSCNLCADCGLDWLYECDCYRYAPDSRDDGQQAAMALWASEVLAEGRSGRKLG